MPGGVGQVGRGGAAAAAGSRVGTGRQEEFDHLVVAVRVVIPTWDRTTPTVMTHRAWARAIVRNCVNIQAKYAPTWHVFRNTTNYYAAQGEVVIRQLRGCTNASGSLQNCAAQVWPANMQGTNDFKQIGYANVGSPSDPATCNSSAMNWWATCCSGFTENVSGMSLAFFPAVGDTVRFSIYRYAPGGFIYWRLKVDDLSHAGWYGWRDLIQIDPSVGEVWYGIEDHSKQSQFGSSSSTNRTRLRGLSYRLSNGSAWTYLTGTSNVAWASDRGLGRPSCWINSITTYSGPIATNQTDLNGYTSSC